MIYFIQQGDDGPIKIGQTANDPIKRMAELQIGASVRLRLLAVADGCERCAHRMFAHLRLTGEWFKSEPDLLAFIEQFKEGEAVMLSQFRRYQGERAPVDYIRAWIKKTKPSRFTGRDISRRFHRFSREACHEALDQLAGEGVLVASEQAYCGIGRRPTRIYEVGGAHGSNQRLLGNHVPEAAVIS